MDEKAGSGVNVPLDPEQIAAQEGRVTQKEVASNQNMQGQVVQKMTARIEDQLVSVNRSALEAGLEERRKAALAAREHDNPTQTTPTEKKKSWWDWLLGS